MPASLDLTCILAPNQGEDPPVNAREPGDRRRIEIADLRVSDAIVQDGVGDREVEKDRPSAEHEQVIAGLLNVGDDV